MEEEEEQHTHTHTHTHQTNQQTKTRKLFKAHLSLISREMPAKGKEPCPEGAWC